MSLLRDERESLYVSVSRASLEEESKLRALQRRYQSCVATIQRNRCVSAAQVVQQRRKSKDRRVLTNAAIWDVSPFKLSLALSLRTKLLLKLVLTALKWNACERRVAYVFVEQLVVLAKHKILRKSFNALLFEALSTKTQSTRSECISEGFCHRRSTTRLLLAWSLRAHALGAQTRNCSFGAVRYKEKRLRRGLVALYSFKCICMRAKLLRHQVLVKNNLFWSSKAFLAWLMAAVETSQRKCASSWRVLAERGLPIHNLDASPLCKARVAKKTKTKQLAAEYLDLLQRHRLSEKDKWQMQRLKAALSIPTSCQLQAVMVFEKDLQQEQQQMDRLLERQNREARKEALFVAFAAVGTSRDERAEGEDVAVVVAEEENEDDFEEAVLVAAEATAMTAAAAAAVAAKQAAAAKAEAAALAAVEEDRTRQLEEAREQRRVSRKANALAVAAAAAAAVSASFSAREAVASSTPSRRITSSPSPSVSPSLAASTAADEGGGGSVSGGGDGKQKQKERKKSHASSPASSIATSSSRNSPSKELIPPSVQQQQQQQQQSQEARTSTGKKTGALLKTNMNRCRWAIHMLHQHALVSSRSSKKKARRVEKRMLCSRAWKAWSTLMNKRRKVHVLCERVWATRVCRHALTAWRSKQQQHAALVLNVETRANTSRLLFAWTVWRKYKKISAVESAVAMRVEKQRLKACLRIWRGTKNLAMRLKSFAARRRRGAMRSNFAQWSSKARDTKRLRSAFSLIEKLFALRGKNLSAFGRVSFSWQIWKMKAMRARVKELVEWRNLQATLFRQASLLAQFYLQWCDFWRARKRAQRLYALRLRESMEEFFICWRDQVRGKALIHQAQIEAHAAKRRLALARQVLVHWWHYSNRQQRILPHEYYLKEQLLRKPFLAWKMCKPLRLLHDVHWPKWQAIKTHKTFRTWIKQTFVRLHFNKAFETITCVANKMAMRVAFAAWPGRRAWLASLELRKRVQLAAVSRVVILAEQPLVSSASFAARHADTSENSNKSKSKSRSQIEKEAKEVRSFIHRTEAPVEQRAVFFGYIISVDDLAAVRLLFNNLCTVLGMWHKVAHQLRVMRVRFRIVGHRAIMSLLGRSFSNWMRICTQTTQRRTLWLKKVYLRPHDAYLAKLEVDRRRKEEEYVKKKEEEERGKIKSKVTRFVLFAEEVS